MASTLKTYILKHLGELEGVPVNKLTQDRYDKFRRLGQFIEDASIAPPKPPRKNGKSTEKA